MALSALAQCPPNLDFENGDLKNWQCATGLATDNATENFITLFNSDPMPGRHEIISSQTAVKKDPYGNFPTLCPYGGKYSVKLGNENTGAEAEGISYTFTIPADVDTLTFTYFYAVVFQDPQHDTFAQPRFFVTAYDVETGKVINCASYDYIATSALPGFKVSQKNSEVLYKDWSPVSLQFAGLNGRQVRLEFKTADCTWGGHFGYAYLDVGTSCSNILATAPYCIETNSLTLNAPYGFKQYTWYNQDYSTVMGTGQSITFSPPPAVTGTFFVDMEPYPGFGCRDTASATVLPIPIPATPVADTNFFCQFSPASAIDAVSLPEHDLLWYTGPAGGSPSEESPIIPSMNTDTLEFYVSQKKLFGCESLRTKAIAIVLPTPDASFSTNMPVQCQEGNQFIFSNTSAGLNNAAYYWDFGDGTTDSSGNIHASHGYKDYGIFQVKLSAVNDGGCSDDFSLSHSVIPKPVPQFETPPVICENETLVQISDRSYTPSGIGAIAQWKWMIDGNAYTGQQVPAFTAGDAGKIDVQLSLITDNGCLSDTLFRTLYVRYKPLADFAVENNLCENRFVVFEDRSVMPAGAGGESIASWHWEFDGASYSAQRQPAKLFADGMHQAKLVLTSNYGCKSGAMQKSFVVNPKPMVDLRINDSCVKQNIFYRAIDLEGTVSHWYWDFGEGWKEGQDVVRKNFDWESDQSFTLMSKTNKGCMDTIRRAFRIYDNDTYAGNDTLVAKGQPVQLNALGGRRVQYTWSPADGLNNAFIENPVATLDRDQLYTLYAVTDKGCERTSDIFIKRYKGADIYIPNAFTPNGDGNNDALKVFPVGIRVFQYFAVFNRYGQQVFYTTDAKKGWDGRINGIRQDAGTYIAVSKAIDYNGKPFMKKENVVLLR